MATKRSKAAPLRSGTGTRRWGAIGAGVVLILVAVVVGWGFASSRSDVAASGLQGTVVKANGGEWTNITPTTLESMLKHKDFTLLNVKTPYMGEIAGTDLYIPYTDVKARSAELPTDKAAPIVVYCRSGNESAVASQALVDLGYTDIANLDGGMTAWVAGGGRLVQVAH